MQNKDGTRWCYLTPAREEVEAVRRYLDLMQAHIRLLSPKTVENIEPYSPIIVDRVRAGDIQIRVKTFPNTAVTLADEPAHLGTFEAGSVFDVQRAGVVPYFWRTLDNGVVRRGFVFRLTVLRLKERIVKPPAVPKEAEETVHGYSLDATDLFKTLDQ
jgi:hypothetical protein